MGTTSSKDQPDNKSLSSSSMRKFSKSQKESKIEQLQKKCDIIQNVQTEIDLFGGDRRSPRYSQIQETLASISKDFQETKNSTSKPKLREKCDYALNDIQKCLQRLENRVSFNEQHLDGAAIESHSFINHTFNPPPKPAPIESPPVSSNRTVSPSTLPPRDYEHAQNLDRLEHETHKLEQDVKLSIQLDDTKQLTFLEKKIQILYTDLEMIVIDSRNPLSDSKAAIGKRLIKCNNQIKKYRRVSIHGKQNLLARIERKLENLEIEALTFEGVKNDRKFKEIEQDLTNYLNEVSQIDEQPNTKEITEKIKNTLHELVTRAEENHKQLEADEKLKQQERSIKLVQDQVKQYKGSTTDSSYIQLDQNLRSIWANISEIEDVNEHIRIKKEKMVSNVQSLLKSLSQNAKTDENQNLTKIKELQKLWNQINQDLDVKNVQSDESKSITEVLKQISEEINKKTKALETIERRKSTSNLVVTKLIHLEDVSRSQVSLTDIVPVKTEIKVQPTLTTITEVQRIESEIKSLSHEIKQSSFTKNSSHYRKYQQKLEYFNNALMKIESNKNGTIDSNKRRALKALREAYGILEERKEKSDRTSKAFEFMDVHTEIQFYRQQIKTFKGVTKDNNYEKIKQGLSNSLTKLQVNDEEHAAKQDFIRQIQQYHQELETKLAENQAIVKRNEKNAEIKRQTSQETKNVIEKVQKLKSQVERFSGVFEGLQFKQIQEELVNCNKKLENIDALGDERLESAKVQTKQKIRKYLKILEEKSTKNEIVPENIKQNLEEEASKSTTVPETRKSQSFEVPHFKINALRDRLVVIKTRTEEFIGKWKDKEYLDIERELLKCLDDLKAIHDEGHKSIVSSKEQYEDYIIKLLAYFEEKTKLAESKTTNEEAFTIVDPTKTLTAIENSILTLKTKIETSNEDFGELMKLEAAMKKELEEVEVGNVAHIRDIKKQLADNLQDCGNKLKEYASTLKKIKDVKDKVNEVYKNALHFNGTKNDEQYSYLDESLIALMVELDNLNCYKSGTLNKAKADARKLIEKSMKTLSDRVKMVPILI
ncbi:hypothetical protein FQR65_LT12005 [Abscondita terminalis]|nr:hypothetical protein FQR65_LT12005 [Abscondita terminalis]